MSIGYRIKTRLGRRADAWSRIAQFIEASLRENQGKPPTSKHIAVVAHGIFNSEFTGALLARRQSDRPLEWGYKGALCQTLHGIVDTH